MSNLRINDSTRATIDMSKIFASGTFKNVWKGTYTEGRREGELCVSKQFKTGSVFEDHYFDEELAVIERTQRIIDDFDNADVINCRIILNIPQIWEFVGSGHKNLVEPMIENFEKFNSNSGWAPVSDDAWSEAMQALSHFSYHNSGGQLLLCDLQGGAYQNGYILSDPVIMSQRKDCGPADLGPDGIRSFFHRHRCGRFCKRDWTKPRLVGGPTIPMREGTSMIANLPTRQSRNPLSRLRE